jgi:hypothetical protein
MFPGCLHFQRILPLFQRIFLLFSCMTGFLSALASPFFDSTIFFDSTPSVVFFVMVDVGSITFWKELEEVPGPFSSLLFSSFLSSLGCCSCCALTTFSHLVGLPVCLSVFPSQFGQGQFNNVVYNGEWKNGKRHGRGVIKYDTTGQNCYEGEWREGKRHGDGMIFYASGNKFAGKWENDKQEGYGIMYWFDRGEIYKGEWKQGVQSGQGEHVWLDQNAQDKDSSNSTQKQMCNRYKV